MLVSSEEYLIIYSYLHMRKRQETINSILVRSKYSSHDTVRLGSTYNAVTSQSFLRQHPDGVVDAS